MSSYYDDSADVNADIYTTKASDQNHFLGGSNFSKEWIPWIFVGLAVVSVGAWLFSKKR
jgi:hypothetical protein